MNKDKLILCVLLALGVLSMGSCGEDDERTRLTTFEKKMVDSIYSKEISYIRKSADSICKANTEAYFEYYVDSLRSAYIEEIGRLEEYLKSGSDE